MSPNEAAELIAFNDWANTRLLDVASALPSEAWTRGLGGAFPTLLALFTHVVGAEEIWLARWRGESPTAPPGWMADPEPAVLRTALAAVEAERVAFVGGLSAEALARRLRYTLLGGTTAELPLGTLIRHGVNHSTYHRGQISAHLRRLGTAPPATDLLIFAVERSATEA